MEELKLLIDKIASLREDMDMIQQPRSDFALKHFVVGQHDLPGRQRVQVALELQAKLFAIKRSLIAKQKAELSIDRARKLEGDELDQRKAQLKIESAEIDIAEIELGLLGAMREANTLLAILSTMPKYTREQLEAEEAEYWKRRLTRQYVIGQRDLGGNLDAVLQTLTEPGREKPRGFDASQDILGLLGMGTPEHQLTK